MKIFHFLPLVLVSVKCASSFNEKDAEVDVVSFLIDEIIEKAVEKYNESTEEGKVEESKRDTELKDIVVDCEYEVSSWHLINPVIKTRSEYLNQVIPDNKTIQRPAPQNKFLLLLTSLIVVIVSLIISIFVNK